LSSSEEDNIQHNSLTLTIRRIPQQDYVSSWQAMQLFTDTRNASTQDEIWLLEHAPVFTQGQAGKAEHVLDLGDMPIVQSDRGGQVTYHGPGQLMMYILLDLKRLKIGVRGLVTEMEQALISCLAKFGIGANADPKAPGVYVNGSKIASLGLRVRKGCSFHGLALNVDMDLTPFERINPCGYAGLNMVQVKDFCGPVTVDEVASILSQQLAQQLSYQHINTTQETWVLTN